MLKHSALTFGQMSQGATKVVPDIEGRVVESLGMMGSMVCYGSCALRILCHVCSLWAVAFWFQLLAVAFWLRHLGSSFWLKDCGLFPCPP